MLMPLSRMSGNEDAHDRGRLPIGQQTGPLGQLLGKLHVTNVTVRTTDEEPRKFDQRRQVLIIASHSFLQRLPCRDPAMHGDQRSRLFDTRTRIGEQRLSPARRELQGDVVLLELTMRDRVCLQRFDCIGTHRQHFLGDEECGGQHLHALITGPLANKSLGRILIEPQGSFVSEQGILITIQLLQNGSVQQMGCLGSKVGRVARFCGCPATVDQRFFELSEPSMRIGTNEAAIREPRSLCDRYRCLVNRRLIIVRQICDVCEGNVHGCHLRMLIQQTACLLLGKAQFPLADETANEQLMNLGRMIPCTPGSIEVGPGSRIVPSRQSRLSPFDELLSRRELDRTCSPSTNMSCLLRHARTGDDTPEECSGQERFADWESHAIHVWPTFEIRKTFLLASEPQATRLDSMLIQTIS